MCELVRVYGVVVAVVVREDSRSDDMQGRVLCNHTFKCCEVCSLPARLQTLDSCGAC